MGGKTKHCLSLSVSPPRDVQKQLWGVQGGLYRAMKAWLATITPDQGVFRVEAMAAWVGQQPQAFISQACVVIQLNRCEISINFSSKVSHSVFRDLWLKGTCGCLNFLVSLKQ